SEYRDRPGNRRRPTAADHRGVPGHRPVLAAAGAHAGLPGARQAAPDSAIRQHRADARDRRGVRLAAEWRTRTCGERSNLERVTRTPAGDRWRQMQDLARGQALRLGDPAWRAGDDPYADRVDSFRAGRRTDDNVVDFVAGKTGVDGSVLEVGAGAGRLC